MAGAAEPDYAGKEYWNYRYASTKRTCFDWYAEFNELQSVLMKYLHDEDDVLHVGCGNSHLTEALWSREICASITNIDISEVVIATMQRQCEGGIMQDPRVKWLVMDACEMTFAEKSFQFILEKGTFDALLCEGEERLDLAEKLLDECWRVLRPSGCLFLVTHGNPSERLPLLSSRPWTVTPHKVCYSFPSLLIRELRQSLDGKALSTLDSASLQSAEEKIADTLREAASFEEFGDHLKADESPFCWVYACVKSPPAIETPDHADDPSTPAKRTKR